MNNQDNINNNEEVRSYSGHTSNENHTKNEINTNYSNEEESSDITNIRNTNDEDDINEDTEIQSNEYISDSNDTESYDITDLINHRLNKIIYYLIKNEEVIYIANIKGMYDKSRKSCKCRLLYQNIIMVIIIILQFYIIIHQYILGTFYLSQFILYIFFKIILLYRNVSFNLIDLFFNCKNLMKSLIRFDAIIIYWIVVNIYCLVFFVFIGFSIYIKLMTFPNIKNSQI